MLAGEAPAIFGDGEQTRDFTYIDNVVQANLAAAMSSAEGVSGECFNIGTGRQLSLNSVFETLHVITGFSGSVKYAPPRVGDVRNSQADISRARQLLHYSPPISFLEGLRRTVEWYRAEVVHTK